MSTIKVVPVPQVIAFVKGFSGKIGFKYMLIGATAPEFAECYMDGIAYVTKEEALRILTDVVEHPGMHLELSLSLQGDQWILQLGSYIRVRE